MARYQHLLNQNCNDTIEFESGKMEYVNNTLIWDILEGTPRQLCYGIDNVTDFSTWTVTSSIKEADVALGELPTAGAKIKASGESRELVLVSQTGDEINLYVPKQLGSALGNDGSSAVTGPSGALQYGEPRYYFFFVKATNNLTGGDEVIDVLEGFIRLKDSQSV